MKLFEKIKIPLTHILYIIKPNPIAYGGNTRIATVGDLDIPRVYTKLFKRSFVIKSTIDGNNLS